MRRSITIGCMLLLSTVTFGAQRHPYRERWKHETYGKKAVTRVGVGAAVGQAFNHPSAWGRGAAGFGKRVGAGFATHAVNTTVTHAVAARFHEDLNYHRSTDPRFRHRLQHALVSTVVTHNTRNGRKRPAAGRISGHAAAGTFTALAIPAASGASTAGLGLAVDAGSNVAREFWPKKKHEAAVRR